MNFKPIPNKFEYLNWQEIESIAKDKKALKLVLYFYL